MAALLTDAWTWWTRAQPDRPAIEVDGESLTYGELDDWSGAVARDLRDRHGVRTGDVVAIAGIGSIEWCVAAVAVIRADAVVTPFNTRYRPAELAGLVENCAPVRYLADEPRETVLREAAVPAERIVPLPAIRALRGQGGPPFRAVGTDPDAPVVIAYTSGTTGLPKGVVYSHRSMLWALHELTIKDPIPTEECSMLLTLPIFTVAGIKHAIIHTLARGGKLVVMSDFDPEQALRLLDEQRITQINGVPVIYERMAAVPNFAEYDLSHLRVAQVGGARVSQQLLDAWRRQGVALRHMYGMTEAGGVVTLPRPEQALRSPETCGDRSIYTEFRVVHDDGTPCGPGEVGEIVTRGPGQSLGYWNNPEANAALFRDGWIRTGDLGSADEDGILRFVDRLKDLIISGGFNVSPSEVEGVIAGFPGVVEVVVVSVPDQSWGETGAAVVHASGPLDVEALKQYVAARLAVFKVPSYVVRIDEPLPRMPSGKIARRAVRSAAAVLAEGGRLRLPEGASL